jgi:hypothetical protein
VPLESEIRDLQLQMLEMSGVVSSAHPTSEFCGGFTDSIKLKIDFACGGRPHLLVDGKFDVLTTLLQTEREIDSRKTSSDANDFQLPTLSSSKSIRIRAHHQETMQTSSHAHMAAPRPCTAGQLRQDGH